MRRSGFTLIELLTCAAITATLAGIFLPAVKAAGRRTQLTQCSASMRAIGAGFAGYAANHNNFMPPFTFPQITGGDIVQAGHFGGYSSFTDPILNWKARPTAMALGIFALAQECLLEPAALRCPSARVPEGASYFPYSSRFSTYCMRIPHSRDLFETAPKLANYYGTLLNVYSLAAAGDLMDTRPHPSIVPRARVDLVYRLTLNAPCGDGDFDPSSDSLAADMFWRQDYSAPAPAGGGMQTTYPVQWQWCHKDQFNVLYGDGSVRTREANRTVGANTNAPGKTLANDTANFASYAENVWQYFDGKTQ